MSNPEPRVPAGGTVEPLITRPVIQERIRELGAEITEEYRGKDLMVVAVLKGSFVFLADLVREIAIPMDLDFLGLSSYGSRTRSSGVVRLTSDLSQPIKDRDVLVVEDIVDTGLTMDYLVNNLTTRMPASLKICSLLVKPDAILQPVDIHYKGLDIPNVFVVGFGLDYDGKLRNLPYVAVMRPDDAAVEK